MKFLKKQNSKKLMNGFFTRLLILFALAGILSTGISLKFSEKEIEDKEAVASEKETVHYANPNELDFYETVFKFARKKVDLENEVVVGGIIPHHLLAGDMIAEFFSGLEGREYGTVVLIGPNHFDAGTGEIITSRFDWETPYGTLEGDRELVEKFLKLKGLTIEEEPFEKEHSMNSEVAFIKKTFPETKFVPLIVSVLYSVAITMIIAIFGKNQSSLHPLYLHLLAVICYDHFCICSFPYNLYRV